MQRLAGAAAATAWAALEPLDRRLFRSDYSDVALLGKAVTRARLWPVAGLVVHAANGAAFGLALSLDSFNLRFAAVDDNQNQLNIWIVQ